MDVCHSTKGFVRRIEEEPLSRVSNAHKQVIPTIRDSHQYTSLAGPMWGRMALSTKAVKFHLIRLDMATLLICGVCTRAGG